MKKKEKKCREPEPRTFISSALHHSVFTICAQPFIGSPHNLFFRRRFSLFSVFIIPNEMHHFLSPFPSLSLCVCVSPITPWVHQSGSVISGNAVLECHPPLHDKENWITCFFSLLLHISSTPVMLYLCQNHQSGLPGVCVCVCCGSTCVRVYACECVCVSLLLCAVSHIWGFILAFSVSLSFHLARSLNVPPSHRQTHTHTPSLSRTHTHSLSHSLSESLPLLLLPPRLTLPLPVAIWSWKMCLQNSLSCRSNRTDESKTLEREAEKKRGKIEKER